jgi:ElaB/YqjD/DUF883 family membrane-anchored ribosome-binding protein
MEELIMAPKASSSENKDGEVDIREDIQLLKEVILQTAEDIKTKFKEKSDDLEENMFGFVKQHPVKAIAVSVVAGMVLAKLLQK